MKKRIKENFNSHKIGYYIGIAYLLIILLSILYDLFRYRHFTPGIWPIAFLYIIFLLAFPWPIVFGMILLIVGLLFMFALITTGFSFLGLVFLLPIVLTGYFLFINPAKTDGK